MASPTQGDVPTLSVITPSFNAARFLPETLDSVAALTTDHEHIVIDGGSDDGTVALLESRSDRRLIWESEADRGQTHAVNKGIARSRGELIAWLNADDAYVPANVDKAVDALLADPGADAIFGHMEIVDESGAFSREYRCGQFRWTRYLYFGEYVPTPTIVFRRSLLSKAPTLEERYADAADYDFYLRLLRGASVRHSKLPLVRFRYHPESKSASDPATQVREALEIRLGHARNGLERSLMHMTTGAMRARGRIVSPWPESAQHS